MRVLLAIVAFAAFILNTHTQQVSNGWGIQGVNRTQWNNPHFNRTHWNHPHFNRTQWNQPHFNRSQWNSPNFNRTRWNPQALNRTHNKHHYRPHSTNNTIKNITIPNWPKWNITSPHAHHRPRRSDPKWVAWTQNQTTHNGDLIVGQVGLYDRLLFNQTYRKERRWWSGREKIIEYPKDLPGKYVNRQETIYAIRVYNKFLDGLEANAKILAGGVGFRYVRIELSSPWNRGFQYLVQIFGH